MADSPSGPTSYHGQTLEHMMKNSLVISEAYLSLPIVKPEDITQETYFFDANKETGGVDVIQPLLEERLTSHGMTSKDVFEFSYALIESIQNAQEHSYKFQPGKKVEVSALYTPNYDVFSVTSEGRGPSIDVIKNKINATDNIQLGTRGRGFYIMTRWCDVVYANVSEDSNQEPPYFDMVLIKVKNKTPVIVD